MGMFSPETERLRQLLAEQMTHTTGQSAGGGVTQAKQRMGLVPPWHQTLSGERAGQGFTEALQMMADQRGDMQIGDTSINPMDFINPVAGIFGGKLAKTADLMALRDAMNRAAQGEDVRKVWQDTGWFQSPDGQWRFEIDDSASQLTDKAWEGGFGDGNRLMRVPEALDHRPLNEAYDLTREGFMWSDNTGAADGSYSGGMLTMNPGVGDPRSVALHELQHAIQQREGFARGGSPEMFKVQPSQVNALRMTYDALRDGQTVSDYLWEKGIRQTSDAGFHEALQEAAKKLGMPYDTAADGLLAQLNGRTYLARPSATQGFVDRARKEYERAAKESVMGFDAMEKYRLLAGEAEARAVQSRMNLTPEQRRMRFPLDDYDVPVDELIMRFGN